LWWGTTHNWGQGRRLGKRPAGQFIYATPSTNHTATKRRGAGALQRRPAQPPPRRRGTIPGSRIPTEALRGRGSAPDNRHSTTLHLQRSPHRTVGRARAAAESEFQPSPTIFRELVKPLSVWAKNDANGKSPFPNVTPAQTTRLRLGPDAAGYFQSQ